MDSIAVTSPTFRIAPASRSASVGRLAWCAKGRLEVRERELNMGRHVPVGVLKFSCENHVDNSSVQQTLVIKDSFYDECDNARRRALKSDAGHLFRGSILGFTIPPTHYSLVFETRTGAATPDANDYHVLTDFMPTTTRQKKSTVSTMIEPNIQTHHPVRLWLA